MTATCTALLNYTNNKKTYCNNVGIPFNSVARNASIITAPPQCHQPQRASSGALPRPHGAGEAACVAGLWASPLPLHALRRVGPVPRQDALLLQESVPQEQGRQPHCIAGSLYSDTSSELGMTMAQFANYQSIFTLSNYILYSHFLTINLYSHFPYSLCLRIYRSPPPIAGIWFHETAVFRESAIGGTIIK